jgi:serine/threonine protein kinase
LAGERTTQIRPGPPRRASPASPATESFLRDLDILDRYELAERIATGGFGDIYRATQRSTRQDVAIKVLRLEEGDEGAREKIERFRRETQLCAALQHPNIVRLMDSGEASSGAVYGVFEFVRGNNLADILAAEGALEPSEALHLMGQVLDALACAHAEGVVHRDLKPANIMVAETGARRNAQVLDFGLGTFTAGARLADLRRLTLQGEYLGTPAYSAPEQLLGEVSTPATDLFAWGLICIECLTGEPACDGPVPLIIHRQLGPDPVEIPVPLLDHELGKILVGVTAKDPAQREGSARQVLVALQRVLSEPLPKRDELRGALRVRSPDSSTARTVAELSRIWQVPLRRNPNFTGREEELAELAESLRQRALLAIVALRGLGGVGKSQLALEYAYRHAHEYDLVAWLRAEETETLAEDFAALAEPLHLSERETPDQRRKIEAVRAWLERNTNWLVVFDNAPNPDAIRSFLPRTSTGHVLVTSRHQSWRELGLSLPVEELDPREAVEFLLRRTDESDRAAAAQLAEDLGRLPLALEEAAAYMETTGRSLRTYLPLLRDRQKVLLSGPRLSHHAGTLGGTWEISFRQVEEEIPEATDLLRLCAFLGADDIPVELLRSGRKHLPDALAVAASDPIRFDECIAALRRYSLVKVERDALSLHRLVQLVTRERLPEAERPQWAERALRVAEAGFPLSGMAGDIQPEAGRLLPHALAALSYAESLPSCAIPAGRLLNRTGNYLSARGFHEQARQRLERALVLYEGSPEPTDSHVGNLSADFGLVLFALGETERAITRVERALDIHERLRGPNHLRVAIDLMNLAILLRNEGELERVRSNSNRALEIVRAQLGPGHPLEAQGLATLSRAHFELGAFREARGAADRALEIFGATELYHPLLSNGWSSLGQVELDFGNLDRADDCIAHALAVGEKAYGADHPLVALSTAVRGAIQERRGDLEGARASFERALLSGERTCNRLHADIATARSQLGDVLRRMGEPEEALTVLRHAKDGLERAGGDRSRQGGHVEAALAALHVQLGDLEAGRVHANRALEALDGLFAADHPLRIPAWNLLARIDRESGDAEAARGSAERALASGAAAFDGEHPDLAGTHAVLAALAADAGDASTARAHRERESALRRAFDTEGPLTPRWNRPPTD